MKFRRDRSAVATTNPIEVGTVKWLRELDDALADSERMAKPIFALFQEVPGCAGCQQFGADVLSNPLLVEAIEAEFVPLLIHNNTDGRDAEVLAAFGEPAWNFQVVRFLDEAGSDVIERRDRVWETGPLAARMIRALEASGRDVPTYLRLVEQEHSDRLRTVVLAQSCFWVGEMEIGRIDGVVATEAGFVGGAEVTKALFDPNVTTLESVVDAARQRGVADRVLDDSDYRYRTAPAADQKRQIRGRLRFDGLSTAQFTKLNSFLPQSLGAAVEYVSPSQRRALGWSGRLDGGVDTTV